MAKKKEKTEPRTGIIFHHRETGRAALWIRLYDESKDYMTDIDNSEGRFRVQCPSDIPDLYFCVSDLYMAWQIFERSGKKGLLSYIRAFFQDGCTTKEEHAKAIEDAKDLMWWFLPSGFPDGKIPGMEIKDIDKRENPTEKNLKKEEYERKMAEKRERALEGEKFPGD